MSKFRAALCKKRIELRITSTIAMIMILIIYAFSSWLRLWSQGLPFATPENIGALALILCTVVVLVAARSIIRFSEWQFYIRFSCDAPRHNQRKVRAVLRPQVDHGMVLVAAAYQAALDYRQALSKDIDLEIMKRTTEGSTRAELYERLLLHAHSAVERTRKTFIATKELARAFGFATKEHEEYVAQLRARDESITALNPSSEAAAS